MNIDYSTKHKVKRLNWIGAMSKGSLNARTPFGSYTIKSSGDGYVASYYFEEYDDEGYEYFKSIDECLYWCSKNWLTRMSSALEECE